MSVFAKQGNSCRSLTTNLAFSFFLQTILLHLRLLPSSHYALFPPPKYSSPRLATSPHQSALSNHQSLHIRSDDPLPPLPDLRSTTFSLNHDQLARVPRPPSVEIAKHTSHTQVPLVWGILVLLIAARADGYPIPAHSLPLLHLHRRDESDSNVIGYSGLAVAVIGVIIAALGVFQGRRC